MMLKAIKCIYCCSFESSASTISVDDNLHTEHSTPWSNHFRIVWIVYFDIFPISHTITHTHSNEYLPLCANEWRWAWGWTNDAFIAVRDKSGQFIICQPILNKKLIEWKCAGYFTNIIHILNSCKILCTHCPPTRVAKNCCPETLHVGVFRVNATKIKQSAGTSPFFQKKTHPILLEKNLLEYYVKTPT